MGWVSTPNVAFVEEKILTGRRFAENFLMAQNYGGTNAHFPPSSAMNPLTSPAIEALGHVSSFHFQLFDFASHFIAATATQITSAFIQLSLVAYTLI